MTKQTESTKRLTTTSAPRATWIARIVSAIASRIMSAIGITTTSATSQSDSRPNQTIQLTYNGSGKAQVVWPTFLAGEQKTTNTFNTIDQACDFLEDSLLVSGDSIDDAMIKLHAHNHNVAIFTMEGKLHSTSSY